MSYLLGLRLKKILGGILHDQSNKDKSMRLVDKLGRLERVEAGQARKLPRSGFVHLPVIATNAKAAIRKRYLKKDPCLIFTVPI
jgi:hypothetical protein